MAVSFKTQSTLKRTSTLSLSLRSFSSSIPVVDRRNWRTRSQFFKYSSAHQIPYVAEVCFSTFLAVGGLLILPTSRKRLAARVHVTPGVALITSLLVKVSLPSYLLYHTVEHCWPTIDSHLGWGCYSVLGSLVLLSLHIFVTYLHSVYCLYRARALGARPIPSVNGRWPGNFDLLREWLGIWKNGYPGDIAGRIMHRLESNTYHVKMFWRDTVFTADPEIVREMLTTDHANYVKGISFSSYMSST